MAQKDLSKIIRKSMSQSRFHNSSMSNLQNSSTIKSSYD